MTEPTWRKSSFSHNDNCVEVAEVEDQILVRNSNRIEAGTLAFTREEISAWILGCKDGEFDDLT